MAGSRFDFHLFPQGMTGGVMLYPVSGVESGLIVSAPAIKAGTGNEGILTFNLSVGAARLDGRRVTLDTALTATEIDTGSAIASSGRTVEIWLNPRRLIRALTAAPSTKPDGTSTPANGDRYIQVDNVGVNQHVNGYYQYNSTTSSWVTFNPASIPPSVPGSHMNLPMNAQVESISALSLALANEKVVYHKTAYLPDQLRPGAHFLRIGGGVRLATLSFAGSTPVITKLVKDVDRVVV